MPLERSRSLSLPALERLLELLLLEELEERETLLLLLDLEADLERDRTAIIGKSFPKDKKNSGGTYWSEVLELTIKENPLLKGRVWKLYGVSM